MLNLLGLDELQIYRGADFEIVPGIVIHQPTLGEICDFGEDKYFGMIHNFTSVGADLKWQLWDAGIDYTKISDYELFYNVLHRGISSNQTQIILKDLDISEFKLFEKRKNDITEMVLYHQEKDIIINEYVYTMIVSALRSIHGVKRDNKMPGNNSTKMILIEDARDEYERNKNKEHHSQLKNLVSAMINCEGFKYSHSDVWNMKINAFMDSVQRIQKIKNASLLLQSGYSGFGMDLKKIDDKKLNWTGELD